MANEFDQAYEFVKSCNYLGSICSLKDELKFGKGKEDMIFIIDKNSERFYLVKGR